MPLRPLQIAESFVGTPYKLGGVDRKEGLDCFSFILRYIEDNKIKIPSEWGGFTYDNFGEEYRSRYLKDPEYLKNVMVDFVAEFTNEIEPDDAMPGDILLLEIRGRSMRPFLAVLAGSGRVFASTETHGIVSINIRNYRILRAFRCHQQ